jgi:hypothetical protein
MSSTFESVCLRTEDDQTAWDEPTIAVPDGQRFCQVGVRPPRR